MDDENDEGQDEAKEKPEVDKLEVSCRWQCVRDALKLIE